MTRLNRLHIQLTAVDQVMY